MKTWQILTLGVVIGLLSAGIVFIVSTQPRGEPILLDPPPTPSPLMVQVVGSVQHPGTYQLPKGSRVESAIQASGGFTDNANPEAINLAQLLQDGERVYVPSIDQTTSVDPSKEIAISTDNPAETGSPQNQINLNTASQAELEELPSIGPSKAKSIIQFRNEHGAFTSIEQLLDVQGIGPVLFDQIKNLVTIGDVG